MRLPVIIALGLCAGPAMAQEGDAEAGQQVFDRQCVTCHVIETPEGESIAGRGGQQGPNLYNVMGRTAGTVEDFDQYSDDMVAAGEAGLEWNEEDFLAYVENPTSFLREYLDDRSARGAMVFQLRDEEDRHNVYAFLASHSPDMDASGSSGDGAAEGSETTN